MLIPTLECRKNTHSGRAGNAAEANAIQSPDSLPLLRKLDPDVENPSVNANVEGCCRWQTACYRAYQQEADLWTWVQSAPHISTVADALSPANGVGVAPTPKGQVQRKNRLELVVEGYIAHKERLRPLRTEIDLHSDGGPALGSLDLRSYPRGLPQLQKAKAALRRYGHQAARGARDRRSLGRGEGWLQTFSPPSPSPHATSPPRVLAGKQQRQVFMGSCLPVRYLTHTQKFLEDSVFSSLTSPNALDRVPCLYPRFPEPSQRNAFSPWKADREDQEGVCAGVWGAPRQLFRKGETQTSPRWSPTTGWGGNLYT